MPSKHMLPKGQRRRTVKPEYRATRGVEEPTPPPIPVIDFDENDWIVPGPGCEDGMLKCFGLSGVSAIL